ncbi:transcription initiation factor TFIID subunit 3 isoform X2 [Diachasmimorpha longicaudata]|uniref:transcription initiation factor TFIID subunit 3 isoform X2 n=1 Tax=Diachasmimorpha longicaudata TaxID=58733 RepID=UPI0030B883DE
MTLKISEIPVGRTEVNLDDLGLAFQHMSIDIEQLAEYVRNVDSIPCAVVVPHYPLPQENHLNFLKPGSREVVTRPVHIHEHLPAMHPDEEMASDKEPEIRPDSPLDRSTMSPGSETSGLTPSPEVIFKRPGEPVSDSPGLGKRTRGDSESRPLREIHSVMMTTSGFLSPAREGKLPEPRTPVQARADSPPPATYPMVPPELKTEKKVKKVVKKTLEDKKLDKENKKKSRKQEDLFKADKITEPKVKKLVGMKETAKLKPLKPGGGKTFSPSTSPTPVASAQKEDSPMKISKSSTPKGKGDKESRLSMNLPEKKEENVDKLPSEHDKQKLNIFKKISKPRDDKGDVVDHHKHKDELRDNSLGLVIDEVGDKHRESDARREEKKVPHTPDVHGHGDSDIMDLRSPNTDVYMFDDMSPPGTPSTPKTPELNVPGPPVETKKKRKEKGSKKKDNSKGPGPKESPQKSKMVHDINEEVLGRPKTPEALETCFPKDRAIPPSFPYFPSFPAAPGLIPTGPLIPPGPGLIPHSLSPMFARFPLPIGRGMPPAQPILQHLPVPRPPFLPSTNMKIIPPRYDAFPPAGPSHPPVPMKVEKVEKIEKIDKKPKKHKIDKKDKIKKKKDKKDKHKEKLEKNKEKKEKLEKIREKKEKRDKRKEKEEKEKEKEKESESVPKLTLKLGKSSPRPPTPDNPSMKKITIKPLLKKPEDIVKRESSPELAKISALVTRPPKPKIPKIKAEKKEEFKEHGPAVPLDRPVATIVDNTGHQVWICPACGNQDDGTPMIGCDDCDAWYHWVCVGMQVPPADEDDWYCRICITKKQELHHDKKKNKRRKKVKISV